MKGLLWKDDESNECKRSLHPRLNALCTSCDIHVKVPIQTCRFGGYYVNLDQIVGFGVTDKDIF